MQYVYTLPGRNYRFGNYCYITTYCPIVIRHGLLKNAHLVSCVSPYI